MLANVKELFAQYDVNKSGCLSKQELAELMQKLGFSVKEALRIFELADTNRDGGISEMEFYKSVLLTINAPKESRLLHIVVVVVVVVVVIVVVVILIDVEMLRLLFLQLLLMMLSSCACPLIIPIPIPLLSLRLNSFSTFIFSTHL